MKSARKKLQLRFWAVLAALMITAAAATFYFFFREEKQPAYMTAPVTRGDIEITVLASGTVESSNLVSVGAQVSGQLKSLQVELGDTVEAGQVVAEIDSLPQQNTLQTRTAALAATLAQKQAKEASLHLAELTLQRQAEMLRGDAASQDDFDNAEANLNVIRAELIALDAQIEQARIAVDTARLDLGYTMITSPIDGVVVAIVTKEGQTVNANQLAPTIIKVARLDQMTIKVEISEADVIRVQPGQKVYYSILGEPESRYPGQLRFIEPAPESISSEGLSGSSAAAGAAIYYMGILDVPNDQGTLRIAMTAQVFIVLAEAHDVLTVPAAALGDRDEQGRYLVWVETAPNRHEQRPVRIGLNNNVRAEVLEGLVQGDRVAIGEQVSAQADTSMPRGRRGGVRIL
ncbi:efflux RND transporter periplasmic adaptor subunit [Desulfobulbus alkaliphilus]|uniref:efflux RND transporter periplasmic adaptor subunit n=1 Tax=Desulfobulbus alkaliphilus TaxID=869814 RepID=UPI0019648F04|nr:efflux RND transporter periplasmic adaptor subunit [Desulfobulbus alkaliphilus]MBM9537130.1 efflux RND transporter periplasmic adaptor subunit [Desulfobulbus alkaliphilus]